MKAERYGRSAFCFPKRESSPQAQVKIMHNERGCNEHLGIFGAHAVEYIDAGLPVFPVDPDEKRPLIKNWQKVGLKSGPELIEKFLSAAGIGLIMGRRSGITEVDVDMPGDAALAAAIERFGETPIIIRTASQKAKLWYSYRGEKRKLRVDGPGGVPIDVLGAGYTIAPPSMRASGASYRFVAGSLADLDQLPPIREGALEAEPIPGAPEGVQRGRRNDSLFRAAMMHARSCDSEAALLEAMTAWAARLPEPLERAEIERTCRSAWGYELRGKNIVALKRPVLTDNDVVMDQLKWCPEAYWLLHFLLRWHRQRDDFAIAPRAMSEAQNPPWPPNRIKLARDILLPQGFLIEIEPPNAKRRRAGRYRLKLNDRPGTA